MEIQYLEVNEWVAINNYFEKNMDSKKGDFD